MADTFRKVAFINWGQLLDIYIFIWYMYEHIKQSDFFLQQFSGILKIIARNLATMKTLNKNKCWKRYENKDKKVSYLDIMELPFLILIFIFTCLPPFLLVGSPLICFLLFAIFLWVVNILKYRNTIRNSGMKNEPEVCN